MSLRKLLIAMAAFGASAAASAFNWQPVPGAPEVGIATHSIQSERSRVLAWLRWWGRPTIVPELASHGAKSLRIHRTAVQMEFDCQRRLVRALAVQAYDGDGKVLLLSSVPGPSVQVTDGDLGWTYDAVCELSRAGLSLRP
jgi:hypothetical protein